MFDPFIAPSGTLLGLLQRGRGDGTLHALAAPRPEALAALNHCVVSDPRHDWQVENRSLYYARLYLDLDGGIEEIERHLLDPDDHLDTDDSRTGLALSVLGHLASYGRGDALALLRRYTATGANWAWALDELALRDDDACAPSRCPSSPASPPPIRARPTSPPPYATPSNRAPGGCGPTTRAKRSGPVSGPRTGLVRPVAAPDAPRGAPPRLERPGRLRLGPAGPGTRQRTARPRGALPHRRRRTRRPSPDRRGSAADPTARAAPPCTTSRRPAKQSSSTSSRPPRPTPPAPSPTRPSPPSSG